MPVKIRVRNFQSIAEANVEVDQFTVITGSNNTGKTALQRAVQGVFQNTSGTAYIRDGSDTCSVEVDFGADGKVRWEKGTSRQGRPKYEINDGDPIYPGSAVPEEVAAFGVASIQAGGQDIWPTIAPQFSGQIFLLDKPGSVLAEAVANVDRVGQLNDALRSAEKDRRQVAATLKVRRTDLVSYEVALGTFSGLDAVVEDVHRLEAQHEKIATVKRAVIRLSEMRAQLLNAKAAAQKLSSVGEIDVPSELSAKQIEKDLLDLQRLRVRLTSARTDYSKYVGADDVFVSIDDTPPKRLQDAIKVLVALKEKAIKAKSNIATQQKELEQVQVDLLEATAEVEATLADLDQCPTCGTEMRCRAVERISS